MNLFGELHLRTVLSHGESNPNPFDLTEVQFEEAKKIGCKLIEMLHADAGHSIELACSSTLFAYESLLKEFVRVQEEKSRG